VFLFMAVLYETIDCRIVDVDGLRYLVLVTTGHFVAKFRLLFNENKVHQKQYFKNMKRGVYLVIITPYIHELNIQGCPGSSK
jgi:hypothetical protein